MILDNLFFNRGGGGGEVYCEENYVGEHQVHRRAREARDVTRLHHTQVL